MGTAVVAERCRQWQYEAAVAGSSGSENHPLSIGEFGIGHLALLIMRPAKIAGLALTEARDGFRAEDESGEVHNRSVEEQQCLR